MSEQKTKKAKFGDNLSFAAAKGGAAKNVPAAAALLLGAAAVKSDKKDTPASVKVLGNLGKAFTAAATVVAEQKTFEGKAGSFLVLQDHSRGLVDLPDYKDLLAFGVGENKDCHSQNILHWGGKIAAQLKHLKIASTDLYLDSFYQSASSAKASDAPKDFAGRPLPSGLPSIEDFMEKLCQGFLLGSYRYTRYKSQKKKDEPAPRLRIVSSKISEKTAQQILQRAVILAEAAYLTRDLQTTPGNDMTPSDIAKAAQEAGKDAGFNVTVWDEKKLAQEGMNGILSVGQGSANPPRFIQMEWNASKKNLPTVVLVGKGISFDTGGISIKPALGMDEMKMDMSGSAAVIGAMTALSKLKVPVHVVGLVASAENMPSGTAVKPGDIYTAYDGQTVEVLNTDAEGRLVLADALAYAKKFNPDCVIDIATLTGACVIALGHIASGLMGNDGALIDAYKKASDKAGEKVWELPLYPEYEEDMISKIADYRNVGDRTAGSEKAGVFLNFFVKNAYPWLHLDVAGTADTPKGQGAHCPPDVGTAVPMAGLVEFTANFEQYFKKKKA